MSSRSREPSQPSQVMPIICRNNCGFYGNPVTGLCSKCQKSEDEKKQQVTETSSVHTNVFTQSSPIDISGRKTTIVPYDMISSSSVPEHMLFTQKKNTTLNDDGTQTPLEPSSPSSKSMLSETHN